MSEGGGGTLRKLKLNWNSMDDSCVKGVIDCAEGGKGIKVLEVSNNKFMDQKVEDMREAAEMSWKKRGKSMKDMKVAMELEEKGGHDKEWGFMLRCKIQCPDREEKDDIVTEWERKESVKHYLNILPYFEAQGGGG